MADKVMWLTHRDTKSHSLSTFADIWWGDITQAYSQNFDVSLQYLNLWLTLSYFCNFCGWQNQSYWSLVRREKGLNKQVISIIELKQFILGNGWTMKNTILWLIVSNCGWQGICISIHAYTFLLTSTYLAFTLKTHLL